MSIQMASRAKANLVGELVEAPSFQTTTKGDKYARIKLQTTEHFFSNGERKVSKAVHNVTVYHPLCVKLLESFGKPGIHFMAEGKISYEKERMVIVVGQFGGELLLMYTGIEAETKEAAPASTAGTSTTQAAASKPSGGLGRLGNSSSSASKPTPNRDSDQRPSDADLDDDIPF